MSVNTFDPKQPDGLNPDSAKLASSIPAKSAQTPSADGTNRGISVTPAAHAHISAQLRHSGANNVRLGVKESGCNGYMYTLDFVEQPEADDLNLRISNTTHDDIVMVVSPSDIALVGGTQIDLVTEGLNSALRFKNPNAESHCGCGESFSVVSASA